MREGNGEEGWVDLVGQVDHSVSIRERNKGFDKMPIAVFVGTCRYLDRVSLRGKQEGDTSEAKM